MNIQILPALICILAYIVASINIKRGKFKPAPIPRTIWMFVSLISLLALIQTKPSSVSLLLAVGLFGGSIILFLASVHRKHFAFDLTHLLPILGIIFCILIWMLTDNPFLALIVILATDASAIILSMKKIWLNPYYEDVIFWLLLSAASFTSILISLATPGFMLSGFIYISYFFSSQITMLSTIAVRRIIIESKYSKYRVNQLRLARVK